MGQRIDDMLNQDGVAQMKELAEKIDRDFDVIFTSPLIRAKQSAQILVEKIQVPILERKEIMERDFGTLSGKSWDEIIAEVGKEKKDLKKEDFELAYDYRPFGGETAEDVRSRFLTFIEELKRDYSDKKVLVIAHGGILKMAHFLFSELKVEHILNASIHEFDI